MSESLEGHTRSAAAPADGAGTRADTGTAFALSLFAELRARPGNLFFSPFSIRVALAMAQVGARGETAAQMGEVLGITDASQREALVASLERLERLRGDTELSIANSLWSQCGAPLLPEYLETIGRRYGGAAEAVDFRDDAGGATATINRWVAERTKRRIRCLVGGLDPDTRLVLVNAVCFDGRWAHPFEPLFTRDAAFHRGEGGTVEVPTMLQSGRIPYLGTRDLQAVELAYRDSEFALLLLLPRRRYGLAALESHLTAEMLDDSVRAMEPCLVRYFIPRFRMTGVAFEALGALTRLGMTLPFSRSEADFSGINGLRPPDALALYISSVLHKAFVAVDEQGTEAAAATVTAIAATSPAVRRPRVELFRADHPFLFAIRERSSGTILFLGRVADPAAER